MQRATKGTLTFISKGSHIAICRLQFVFWRMLSSKHAYEGCISNFAINVTKRNCGVSTNFHTPEYESQPTNCSA